MFILFSASLISEEYPLYEEVVDNIPSIGVKNEVYLGDRMLIQRTGEYRECILPKVTLEAKMMQFVGGIKKNLPLCKKDADAEAYAFTYRAIEPCQQCVQEYAKVIEKKEKYEIHICAPAPLRPKKLSCPRKFRFKKIEPKNIEFDNEYFLYKEGIPKDQIIPLRDDILVLFDILKGNISFFLKPFVLDQKNNFFETFQAFENLLIVIFTFILFIILSQKNIYRCIFWYSHLFFAGGLYGLVVFNAGSLVRYKFTIIISFFIVMLYDFKINVDNKIKKI